MAKRIHGSVADKIDVSVRLMGHNSWPQDNTPLKLAETGVKRNSMLGSPRHRLLGPPPRPSPVIA